MDGAAATQPPQTAPVGRAATVAACGIVVVLTAGLRFLSTVSLSNDEYVSLAGAQQMLFGEWPTRDFLDTGGPLMYAASAASQLVFGRSLFAEVMLTAAAFALAAAITVIAVKRLSGSLAVGVVAGVLEIAFFPRGYAYPKLLLYAAAPLVIWWYQGRPESWRRLFGLAAFVQIAFLFRHDHGAYLGAAAAVAVSVGDGDWTQVRAVLRRVLRFGALTLLTAAPYLAYVAVNGGIVRYFSRGLAVTAGEAASNHLFVPPFGPGVTLAKNYEAFLFLLFCLLPVIAGVVLFITFRRTGSRSVVAQIAPLIVLSVVVDRAFLRDELWTRLVDAYVPAALLFAWLWGETVQIASRQGRWFFRALAFGVTCISAAAVTEVGRTAEQLNRAGLFGGLRRLPERFAERSEQLHDRFNEHQMPSRAVLALVPFFQYVDRCTTVQHRLLLPGQIPEAAVYAERPVAGGRLSILAKYNDAPEDRREIQERLNVQTVPFVLVTPNDRDAVWAAYPELAALVRDQYRPLVTYNSADTGDPAVEVFVSRTLQPREMDSTTGWPCFR